MKIIYIARCDYNQVFLGDFVFLSSVLSRHKNSDHFTEEEETSSLSLFLVSSLHRKRRETRDREREREKGGLFQSLKIAKEDLRKRKEERICGVAFAIPTRPSWGIAR